MNIKPWFSEDLEDLLDSDDFVYFNAKDFVDQAQLDEASKLHRQLVSKDGILFIKRLRAKNEVVVLCQTKDLTKRCDFVRIVLSGRGLVKEWLWRGMAVSKTKVSCLHACCVCRVQGVVHHLDNLSTLMRIQKPSTSSTAGEVDKPPT